MTDPDTLARSDGARIAYHKTEGAGPGVIFFGGFMSDMTGSKATFLEELCRVQGRSFIRFDYQGHGASSGKFADGTITTWSQDALAVLDELTDGPQVLVGSSMGGWIALLTALARPDRVAGLVGIAAAPDFTERLMWPSFSADIQRQIMEEGVYYQPTDYGDEPYAITRHLIEDGRRNLILDRPVPLDMPVRLIHGQKDADVPWQLSLDTAAALTSSDVEVTLVKDGDHRLSTQADLARLGGVLEALILQLGRESN